MQTWSTSNKVALSVANSPATLHVVETDGKTRPVFSVVARATTRAGHPVHTAVATFAGPSGEKEAAQYAALGFLARAGKLQSRA